uniref:Uncharacterized protein n=1 Tax=Rousettus aegyptiacus TaxID=9407 RepID=A0A7J8GBB5_ROUAE|nr:hypothetical protein HJG63_011747 [Rousettus aegyptiacus]
MVRVSCLAAGIRAGVLEAEVDQGQQRGCGRWTANGKEHMCKARPQPSPQTSPGAHLLGTLSVWSWEAALERPAQVSCRPHDAICPHFCHSAVKTRASCLPLICPQRGSLGLASPWLQPLPVRSFFWQWALLSAGRFTGGLRSSPPAP